jgi:hypothetical protein
LRNLHEIGFAALANMAAEGLLDAGWKLHAMGESSGDMYLPRDMIVEELDWMGFDQYAARMRSCDVLLSLMLSPHPSYPPLEGASSGALVVTNHFANKTAAEFAALSTNIIATEPTIDGVTEGLRQAVRRVEDIEARRRGSRMSMPRDWVTALSAAGDLVAEFWNTPQ